MNDRTTAGLAIIAGGLAFVGSASAVDLLGNGSFENPTNAWNGHFSTYNQSAAYYAGPAIPAAEGPGNSYSWQHGSAVGSWVNFVTPAADATEALANAVTQRVALTNALTGAAIDGGAGRYTFSAWLSSYTQNPEQPYVDLRFFDDSGTNQVGSDVALDRATADFWVGNADPSDPTPPDPSNHMWSKYQATGTIPATARWGAVYLTRSYNAGLSGRPDTYIDLVKLNVINVNDTTLLESVAPADGSIHNSPAATVSVVLKDIATSVDTNSVRLVLDGAQTPATVKKSGALTSIQFTPPALFPSLSTHLAQIVWSDTGGSRITTATNQFQFSVAAYADLQLGPAIYSENFDSLAQGSLPPGWSAANLTDPISAGLDYNDPTSDVYTNWAVVSLATLTNLSAANADYSSLQSVLPYQVINGRLLTNLIQGNFALAVSDGRSGGKQIQYLFTRDFDLSGRTNVYVAFHNLYTQNQDSLGCVEYSIDRGTNWFPALYMLDSSVITKNAFGGVDGSNTMAAVHADVPNLADGTLTGGNYGQFIGIPSNRWSEVGPFVSARINDDPLETRRVEVLRVARADNQAAVRLRFAQMGTDSYYFGIDEMGLYSLTNIAVPILQTAPSSISLGVGNSGSFAIGMPLGIGPFAFQWRHNGITLPGQTNLTLAFVNAQPDDAGNYDVVISNPGGSVTSSPPAVLSVLTTTPVLTGQWDFTQGDLRATVGRDLEYYDLSVQTNTSFGTTTNFGLPEIGGKVAHVMWFTPPSGNASGNGGANPSTEAWGGYKMYHGASANGGGTNVNQYTLLYDVLYPQSSAHSWRAILQASVTASTGGDDSEYYLNTVDGVGISGVYHGNVTADQWHRIVLAVDMAGPGLHPVVEKFIDGVKVGEQTAGLDTLDGRFSLNPSLALLFSENNGYNNDAYVSHIQFYNGRLSDATVAALGSPGNTATPAGKLTAYIQGGNVIIQWSGTALEEAKDVTGPWTTVVGASRPYQVADPQGTRKFYRAR